jgi:hypothetical protein
MSLRIAFQVRRHNIRNASRIHIARGNQPGPYKVPKPLSGEGIDLIIVSLSHTSPFPPPPRLSYQHLYCVPQNPSHVLNSLSLLIIGEIKPFTLKSKQASWYIPDPIPAKYVKKKDFSAPLDKQDHSVYHGMSGNTDHTKRIALAAPLTFWGLGAC